jgi:hypothetical protein
MTTMMAQRAALVILSRGGTSGVEADSSTLRWTRLRPFTSILASFRISVGPRLYTTTRLKFYI